MRGSDLIGSVFELLYGLATEPKSPWSWLAVALWAAPFLYFAYQIKIDGGAMAAVVVCLILAALPLLARLWAWVRRLLRST